MKRLILLTLFQFIISLFVYSQIRNEAVIDKLQKNNFNENYLNTYCIHFYYDNELYVLSYDSEKNYDNILLRSINLYRREINDWKYASELIFISNISFNNSIEFMDYPYPKMGNAIVKNLDNKCILLSMSYRETILNNNYVYPIVILFIPNKNKIFKHLIFIPNRNNNRYGINIKTNSINDYDLIMNDETKISIKFNSLNLDKLNYNIKFADEMGNAMITTNK